MRIVFATILFILWLIGIVSTGPIIGGSGDLLLVIALLLLVIELRRDDA